MLVVSDTSPILNLAIIGQLGLLRAQFGTVSMPEAVFRELRLTADLPGNPAVRQAVGEGWLIKRLLQAPWTAAILSRELDEGEAETIAAALEWKADLVLLDEKEARQIAKGSGLRVVGVLGILLRAFSAGTLVDAENSLCRLQTEAHFRLSNDVLAEVAEQVRRIRALRK